MSNNSDQVLISGMNQPMKMTFPSLDHALMETVKNSALYKNATNVRPETDNEQNLVLADPASTNGWDTVSICRVTALNEKIKSEKTYPKSIKMTNTQFNLDGEFDPWQVITGGDGRNVKLRLPMKSGTYEGGDFGKGKVFDLAGISVDIYVKLSYFPAPNPKKAADGNYLLYVNTDKAEETDPIASVIALHDPNGKMDDINKSILRGLYGKWLNEQENLKKFDTLFSTVAINNMGEQSDEYKWLRATAISYAYTDKGTEESSIFGVLCMTNERSYAGLPNQLPAVSLASDNNALFLISRQLFVKYQFKPALPYIFKDSPEASYNLGKDETTINAENLKLDPVRVGAIDYHPVIESFEVTFNETFILTTANIHTCISPGIDAYTTIITKVTLTLGENNAGEQIMTYEMIGDPTTHNHTDVAAWIVVTEAILALVAAVVTTVVGVVAGKVAALIVGIIVATVVALISITIHVIIEKVIAEGATNALPSIAPMVKIATSQVKWPFCQDDAFKLTGIDYSGSIIFKGNLKLAKGYSIVNNRLVYNAALAS